MITNQCVIYKAQDCATYMLTLDVVYVCMYVGIICPQVCSKNDEV